MFDKLIVVAQAVAVEHLVIVHDDGVVQTAAQRQAVGAQMFHVAGKAEGAGASNVAAVMSVVHVKREFLTGGIHRRVFEVNFKTQLEAVVRKQTGPFFLVALAFAHHHLFEDTHKTLGCVLQGNAGALQ